MPRLTAIHPTRFDWLVWAVSGALIVIVFLTVAVYEQRQYAASHVPPFVWPEDDALIAFLYRGAAVPNVYAVSPDAPEQLLRVTYSDAPVTRFAISDDSARIAYTIEDDPQIRVIDLATGALRTLPCPTNCASPLWRPPGGNVITYAQAPIADVDAAGSGRLVTLNLNDPDAQPLMIFSNPLITGENAQWSANGDRIAIYDRRSETTLVFAFRSFRLIPLTVPAGLGALAPDGGEFIYAVPSDDGGTMLMKVPALGGKEREVTRPPVEQPPGVQDGFMAWHPDGLHIASARSHDGEPAQIALIDSRDGSAIALTDDSGYEHTYFAWDHQGDLLAMERIEEGQSMPEIWLLNLETGAYSRLVQNANALQWMNRNQ